LIERVGATKDTGKKINVHCADFDLFPGLSWLHSLRDTQLNAIRVAKCSLLVRYRFTIRRMANLYRMPPRQQE